MYASTLIATAELYIEKWSDLYKRSLWLLCSEKTECENESGGEAVEDMGEIHMRDNGSMG